MDGSERIKYFWWERAKLDKFLWSDLSALNLAITKRYMPEGGRLLDLGCGDGSSSIGLPGLLVDFVRPKGLTICDGQRFVECDLHTFATDERFDVITLYGVANYFDEASLARLYHRCYGWLKASGVLLVKHQCGKVADVIVDGRSDQLGCDYAANYFTAAKHLAALRLAGFDVVVSDPYPERNKWDNTEFKLFECRRSAVKCYGHVSSIASGDSQAKLEMLEIVKSHLDAHGIPFYLMFGTLLGAVRSGEFIEWDTDVDVAILDRHQNRLIDSLADCPLRMIRYGEYYCSLGYKKEYIDIYTYTDDGAKYAYCGGISPFFDEEKSVFDDWSEIDFKGMKFRTVRNPESSLARWYGTDWQYPNPKFTRSQE